MPEQKWPDVLWIVRNGQSAGNVAREEAERAAVPLIDIATRDMDTPLSPLGKQQAAALGRWFGALAASKLPTVVLSSPYVRALETTRLLLDAADGDTRALPSSATNACARRNSARSTGSPNSASGRNIRILPSSAPTSASSISAHRAAKAGAT
jgi:hypothetical protein